MSSWRKQEPALLPTPPSNTYVLCLSLTGVVSVPLCGFHVGPGELKCGLGKNHPSVHLTTCMGFASQLVLGELSVFVNAAQSIVPMLFPCPLPLVQIFLF